MYRAPPSIVPPGSNSRPGPALRSRGPIASQADGNRLFDPVQIGWLPPATRDDLDPDGADPLAPAADDMGAQGLTLRRWQGVDAVLLHGLLDDRALWAHLPEPFPEPFTIEVAHRMIEAANLLDHHEVRAVIVKNTPAGQVRLDYGHGAEVSPTERPEGELSYWLGRAHWGKGLGRALVAGTVTRAFANAPGLLRLVAKVRPENVASRRILEAAGFVRVSPPAERGFPDWDWFALRRQDWAGAADQSL